MHQNSHWGLHQLSLNISEANEDIRVSLSFLVISFSSLIDISVPISSHFLFIRSHLHWPDHSNDSYKFQLYIQSIRLSITSSKFFFFFFDSFVSLHHLWKSFSPSLHRSDARIYLWLDFQTVSSLASKTIKSTSTKTKNNQCCRRWIDCSRCRNRYCIISISNKEK